MTKLIDSGHFVAWQQMPTFDAGTPVLDVYRALADAHRSGFVMKDGDRRLFVNGGILVDEAIESSADLMRLATIGGEGIGALCRRVGLRSAVIPVELEAIAAGIDISPLQNTAEDRVYLVSDSSTLIGYFINHETLLDPATKRIQFICENDHSNPDPDHGTCYQCPGRIVRTELV